MLNQYVGAGSTYETILINFTHVGTLIFVVIIGFFILNLARWR